MARLTNKKARHYFKAGLIIYFKNRHSIFDGIQYVYMPIQQCLFLRNFKIWRIKSFSEPAGRYQQMKMDRTDTDNLIYREIQEAKNKNQERKYLN
jgi:hypothetical protein